MMSSGREATSQRGSTHGIFRAVSRILYYVALTDSPTNLLAPTNSLTHCLTIFLASGKWLCARAQGGARRSISKVEKIQFTIHVSIDMYRKWGFPIHVPLREARV